MVTGVTVNFANPEKAIVANGTYDAITLRNEGTDSERWAILLPQDAVIGGIAKIGESFYSCNVEAVAENSYITSNPINNSAPIAEPLFTVSSNGNFVRFSTGNLQYNKETGKFSFMEHQYSTVETTDQDVGTDYANQNIVSLFGWGTSGWNNGNLFYQPYNTSSLNNSIYTNGYGPTDGSTYTYSLTGTYANADWGVYNKRSNQNKIEGGGNHEWRVLTSEEWDYLFDGRSTIGVDIRFAKAYLFGSVHGMILFPDNYTHPEGVAVPEGVNETGDASWEGNQYDATEWGKMEAAGSVFLPAVGTRLLGDVNSTGEFGCYWTSTSGEDIYAWGMDFDKSPINEITIVVCKDMRNGGHAVRFVR